MAKAKTDMYANVIRGNVAETGATDGGYTKIDLGLGLMNRQAMLLYRFETDIDEVSTGLIASSGDKAYIGLVASTTTLADVQYENAQSVICRQAVIYKEVGTEANWHFINGPRTTDFTGLPGGGLLIPAAPLYVSCITVSTVATPYFRFQLFFTLMDVSDADYIEMLQSRGVFGGGTA